MKQDSVEREADCGVLLDYLRVGRMDHSDQRRGVLVDRIGSVYEIIRR